MTYDRRGTLRSGREDWPGRGSAQHADDAAGLLDALGLADVVVLGASSGGIPAIQLALRHPELVHRALIFEPGLFRHVPGGERAPGAGGLVNCRIPGDASGRLGRRLARVPSDRPTGDEGAWEGPAAAVEPDSLEPPPGMAWYAEREDMDTEALVVDDIPILTRETVDEAALAASPVDFRFAYGTASLPIFREIVTHLAGVRGGAPDAIDGAGHGLVYHPEAAADYIARHAAS